MLDDVTTGASTPLPRCMWCSAALPSDSETTCPSCGATLIEDAADRQVPGVTAIDAEAIIRAGRETKPRQRNRLMSWISGEYPEEEKPAPPGSLAPPPLEVRREMLRLEIEAEVANLQAEAGAIAAEHAVDAVDAGAPSQVVAADVATATALADASDGTTTAAAGEPEPSTSDAADADGAGSETTESGDSSDSSDSSTD